MQKPHGITVIIPTWRRVEKLKKCLQHIQKCTPPPDEVIIHIDAGDEETEKHIKGGKYYSLNIIKSDSTQGPGGGRNILIKHAKHEVLCSLDDDSWPLDQDFFEHAVRIMNEYPNAAVIALNEVRPTQTASRRNELRKRVSCFQGCASLIRRSAFLEIQGYVPLRYAYGMEEADVSLQLLDKGWEIWKCNDLQVYHDSTLTHQATKEINAAHITNTALLAYLRYPITMWPLGAIQVINRVKYALIQKRYSGIIRGLIQIPLMCYKYRKYRNVVKHHTILESRKLLERGWKTNGD